MIEPAATELIPEIFHEVNEVGDPAWDLLSQNRPFQSACWYRYGECVMEDCQPIYIILSQDAQPVARATFWLVRREPLPIHPILQHWVQPIFHRWPLMICRSPLSNLSGLILPEGSLRQPALGMIAKIARNELKRTGGSYLLFDFLKIEETQWQTWLARFRSLEISNPGTHLELRWNSFDDYLKSQRKFRIRQHFRRTSQQAADMGMRISRHSHVEELPTILELIRNVERRHASSPNPWAASMLEQMHRTDSTWLTAHIGDRLVGCMLLVVDNGVQIACLPGLTEDVPYAYFMLLYEAIQLAFEKNLTALYWGSGAYETKRRLGFDLTNNNHIMLHPNGPIPGLFVRLATSLL